MKCSSMTRPTSCSCSGKVSRRLSTRNVQNGKDCRCRSPVSQRWQCLTHAVKTAPTSPALWSRAMRTIRRRASRQHPQRIPATRDWCFGRLNVHVHREQVQFRLEFKVKAASADIPVLSLELKEATSERLISHLCTVYEDAKRKREAEVSQLRSDLENTREVIWNYGTATLTRVFRSSTT